MKKLFQKLLEVYKSIDRTTDEHPKEQNDL